MAELEFLLTGEPRATTEAAPPPDDFLPSSLGERAVRGWSMPPHLRALEDRCLRLVKDPDYNRLVVELPVRHGKSWYCSWVFAAWHMLAHPHKKVILASYEKDFAAEWCVKVQRTLAEYGEALAGVRLGDICRQDHFTLAHPWTGELRTASPGSGVAGRGADLIIADDLVKDMREAANPARRHALATWANSELLSRLEPEGKVLAVMSRRHPDDQSGRWLAQNDELPERLQWHRLRMPAINEANEALWPERYDLQKLLDIKGRYELDGQSYLWESLYQQDPRGDSHLIEWPDDYFAGVEYPELPPDLPGRLRVLSLDPSKGTNAKTGDYSAWADITLDATPRACLWVVPHLKLMPTEQVEDYSVELLRASHYDGFVVECNGFQEMVAENIIKKCQRHGVPCPLWKKTSTEDKEVRIRLGLGPLLAQRRVRVCSRAASARPALAQLKEFPTARHDDFPDALNLGCDLIARLLHGKRAGGDGVTVYRA